MSKLILKDYYMDVDVEISLERAEYAYGGSLAIQMYYFDKEDGMYFPYGTLTVNLEGKTLEKDCAFVDVNNNGSSILEWIEKNGLGKRTGRIEQSGFCLFPEVKFNIEEIDKYKRKDC